MVSAKKWPAFYRRPLHWLESATEPLLKPEMTYIALRFGPGSQVAAGFRSYIRGYTRRRRRKVAPVRVKDAHHDWQHGQRDRPSGLLPKRQRHSDNAGARHKIREGELEHFQPRPQYAGAFRQADYDCNRYGVRQRIRG